MNLIQKIRHKGAIGISKVLFRRCFHPLRRVYREWCFRNIERYKQPGPSEFANIESDLHNLSVPVIDYYPCVAKFEKFKQENWFPSNYHGGKSSGVWDEKLLEHWIASQMLQLQDWSAEEVYVDVAACTSPWAQILRDRQGITAYAIDLSPVAPQFAELDYYKSEDACFTSFADSSVSGVSLQCAYEMFLGDADSLFIKELSRILKPGGMAIILPLYMHTHYCSYSTPEYYGKGYSDPSCQEYVRLDTDGVPSSRKYDAEQLHARVLSTILDCDMSYKLYALRNKTSFGNDIYLNFILEVTK